MSAVSLFMALFVVGSTFGFAVATRQRELGLLRLIGATPRQVRRLLLGEAAVVGLVASSVACLLVTALAPAGLWAVHAMGVTSLKLSAPSPWLAWTIAHLVRPGRRARRMLALVTAGGQGAAVRGSSRGMDRARTPGFAGWCDRLRRAGDRRTGRPVPPGPRPARGTRGRRLPAGLVVIGLQALGPVVVPRVAGFVARPFVVVRSPPGWPATRCAWRRHAPPRRRGTRRGDLRDRRVAGPHPEPVRRLDQSALTGPSSRRPSSSPTAAAAALACRPGSRPRRRQRAPRLSQDRAPRRRSM